MSRNARLGVVAAVVAAAVIAFIALRPSGNNEKTTTGASAPATTPSGSPDTPAATKVTTIRVAGGRPVGGVRAITVKKGDQIRFRVVDDRSDNVHLHGYDVEKRVTPNRPAGYSLPAKIDGVFVIELEDTGVQIGKLTVEP